MIQSIQDVIQRVPRVRLAAPAHLPTRRKRIAWTLGNLLMLVGFYLIVYVGGLYATTAYHIQAARGDSDLPAPRVVSIPSENGSLLSAITSPIASAATFVAPNLNTRGLGNASYQTNDKPHMSTIERVIIPSIKSDSKVVEVGWDVIEQDGQEYAVWQVAEFAVGHHKNSANPGENGNIVLAGHVGGYGKVFRDLYYVRRGEQIILYSNGQQYLYTITQRLVVDEEGASPEQRAQNAQYIEPTDSEVVTLVTCWPLTGKDKFKQRVIIRAEPYSTNVDVIGPGQWTIR
jgi:sortase A